jgi:hypothetical protein
MHLSHESQVLHLALCFNTPCVLHTFEAIYRSRMIYQSDQVGILEVPSIALMYPHSLSQDSILCFVFGLQSLNKGNHVGQ